MASKRLPIVFVDLPACPGCDSTRLDIGGGTRQQGDGSKLQYAKCRDCGERLKIVWDSPYCGLDTEAPE